jgi:Nucleotide-diphospho-sugar transferase
MIPSLDFPVTPEHDMVICSMAYGEQYIKMLRIMQPTVETYTKIYNMDSFIKELPGGIDPSRPGSWDKVILIYHLLKFYKTVMWLDCDAIFSNPLHDIRKDIDTRYAIQLVTDYDITPLFPNGGIWVVQNDPRSFEILEKVWSQTDMIDHPWWEQAAVCNLLGYEPHYGGAYHGPTNYTDWIGPLDKRWNSRPYNNDSSNDPAILHFCRLSYNRRMKEMKKQKKEFFKKVSKI